MRRQDNHPGCRGVHSFNTSEIDLKVPRRPENSPSTNVPEWIEKLSSVLSSTLRMNPAEGGMSTKQIEATVLANHLYLGSGNRSGGNGAGECLQSLHIAARELVGQTFALNHNHVCVEYNSGMDAIRAAISAFCPAGYTILHMGASSGGQPRTSLLDASRSRTLVELPFDKEEHVIDVKALDRSLRPKLVLIDHSNVVRPCDYEKIKEAYPDAVLVVDISHVYLPVVAGEFANPLRNGADVIISSTHKSACGPPKAVSVARETCHAYRIAEVAKSEISHNQPGSVAALAVMASEHLEHGEDHGKAQVENANYLASALSRLSVPVYRFEQFRSSVPGEVCRYTLSPHVWVDCEKIFRSANDAVNCLERAGIAAVKLHLPLGGLDDCGAYGIRLGSTSVTRLGMKGSQMQEIARFIKDILFSERPLSEIQQDVTQLRKRFTEVAFC